MKNSAVALAGLIAVTTLATATAVRPSPSSPPPLVVTIVVDGLSWARLEAIRPRLTHGLGRLLEKSRSFTRCHYRHLNTETAPGHAALSTGAPPRVSGIVGNRWFIRGADGRAHLVTAVAQAGPAAITGAGALRVPTLGDRLLAERSGARVVSVSAKDRAAVFLAGRDRRHAVYWYDKTTGRMVTSDAYDTVSAVGSATNDLVVRFNHEHAGARLADRFGRSWAALPGPPPPSPYPFDLADYQIPVLGLGFDHRLDTLAGGYPEALYESGLVDEVVTNLVVTMIEDPKLGFGRGPVPHLLNVSLSAHDVVAHSYGTESQEADDALRRIDQHVGRILDALDAALGKGAAVVALSADHGFSPIPEALRRAGRSTTGGRLVTNDRAMPSFTERASRLIAAELCLDPAKNYVLATESAWNIAWAGPLPHLTVAGPCGPAGREIDAATFGRAAERVIEHHFAEEVEDVLLVSEREHWPPGDVSEMARNAVDPERTGDALMMPRAHALVHWDPARGSGHGSHHDYDTHVPLLIRGDDFPTGRSDEAVTPYDLAPTLAALLGITMPEAAGRSIVPRRQPSR